MPIELGELREEGFDLKLAGFSDRELAEYLREFDTDLEDADTEADAAETVRCLKCGHEFPVESDP